MNFTLEHEFVPNPKLLPYGGFEVAALLSKFKGARDSDPLHDETIDLTPEDRQVSSGWLRSKILSERYLG